MWGGSRPLAVVAVSFALLTGSLGIVASRPSPDPLQGYTFVAYEHASGFRLPIPVGWDVEENQVFEGFTIELFLYGPYGEGFQTNILVETDRDPAVRETSLYMSNTYQKTLDDIRADDPTANVTDGPFYRTIGNHSAVLFEVRYGTDNVIQRMAIVVSDPHDRFWFVMLSTTPGFYNSFGPMFDEMLDGFEITAAVGGLGFDPVLLGIIVGLVAALGVGGFLAFLVIRHRRRPAPPVWYGPMGPTMLPPTAAIGPRPCPSCGFAPAPGALFCVRCGARLPTDAPPPGPPSPPPSGPPGPGSPPLG